MKEVYRHEGTPESMPKNPVDPGFEAMQKALVTAKKNTPMKPSKPRQRAASMMAKKVKANG